MEPDQRSKYTPWLLAGILLLTFLVYFPSLQNGFTNWDDNEQILANEDVHSLSFAATGRIFTSFYVGMYQPATTQLYAVFYSIFGADATAFHSLSLALHLLNVLLVFILLRSFLKREAPALIAAALFALNPLQTESVAWVSATSNLLYACFYLGGLAVYLKYIRSGNMRYLIFSFLLFIMSLLSKPAAVTFPVVILLADLYFRRRINFRLALEKLPFFILSLVIGILIIYAREDAGHIIDMSERFGWGGRVLMVFYALAFYISRLFAPVGLSAFHPYPAGGLTAEFYIAPIVPLMLIFLVFRLRGEQKRQVTAGLIFFLVSIAVLLDIIPVGVQLVKERYVYLPSVGVYLAFSVLMVFLFHHRKRYVNIVITICFMSVFSLVTLSRAATWENSMSLWNDVLEQYPGASAPLINRGNTWQELGNYRNAVDDYTSALITEPAAADAYLNRGLAFYRLGEPERALADLDRAISLGLEDAEAYNIRGLTRASGGMIGMAIDDFTRALELDPAHEDARVNLALMHANAGRYSLALDKLDEAVRLNASFARAYYWRGMLKLQMDLQDEACIDLRRAVSLGWPAAEIPDLCR
jgi:Tfp pilus assembly protein PilF